jgi:hypothetical protein
VAQLARGRRRARWCRQRAHRTIVVSRCNGVGERLAPATRAAAVSHLASHPWSFDLVRPVRALCPRELRPLCCHPSRPKGERGC